MNFEDITGQKHISENLKKHVAGNKTGHAYVFSGPEGIGKKLMAGAFAKALMCLDPIDGNACDKCMSCNLIRNRANPDYFVLSVEEGNILIDDIRSIQKEIYLRPVYAKRKVYFIPEAERMTVQAQNCLLKILEEPPLYAVLILSCVKFDSMLKTIQSRVLQFRFTKYNKNEIIEILRRKGIEKTQEESFVLNYCNGIPGIALKISGCCDKIDLRKIREDTLNILSKLILEKKPLCKMHFREYVDKEKDNINMILDIIQVFFRDLLIYKTGNSVRKYLINADKTDLIDRCAGYCTSRILINNISAIEMIKESLKQNVNLQLCIDSLVIGIWED